MVISRLFGDIIVNWFPFSKVQNVPVLPKPILRER